MQWTPFGLGRRTRELAWISKETGVHVVAATGLHRAAHYSPSLLRRVVDDLVRLFVADLSRAPAPPTCPKTGGRGTGPG